MGNIKPRAPISAHNLCRSVQV